MDESYFINASEEEIIECLSSHGNLIEYLPNPTFDQQLAAIKQNGYAIRFIKKPSEEIIDMALKINPLAIRFIKDPSTKQIARSFEKDPNVIAYIKNPTYEQKISALTRKGCTIQFIKEIDNELIQLALKNNNMALCYVYKYLEISELIEIVKINPKAVRSIINKVDYEVQKECIEIRGDYIKYVKNQNIELCMIAIRNNPLAYQYCKDKTEVLKQLVFESGDIEAIKMIELFDNNIS